MTVWYRRVTVLLIRLDGIGRLSLFSVNAALRT